MESKVNSSSDEFGCPDHIYIHTHSYLSIPNCRDPLDLAATQDRASAYKPPKKLHSMKISICLPLGSHNFLEPELMQQDKLIPEHSLSCVESAPSKGYSITRAELGTTALLETLT